MTVTVGRIGQSAGMRTRWIGPGLAAMLLLAGCGGQQAPTPAPSSTSASTVITSTSAQSATTAEQVAEVSTDLRADADQVVALMGGACLDQPISTACENVMREAVRVLARISNALPAYPSATTADARSAMQDTQDEALHWVDGCIPSEAGSSARKACVPDVPNPLNARALQRAVYALTSS